jgi:hypothetical protein
MRFIGQAAKSLTVQFWRDFSGGLVAMWRPSMRPMTLALVVLGADLFWVVATHG